MLAKIIRLPKPELKLKSHIVKALSSFKWKWVSIFLLGVISNTMINAVFDYKYQRPLISFSLEEYVNAIIASYVLLQSTRWLTRKLDKRVPWNEGVTKRLITQSVLNLVLIVLVLNTLLVSITYFFYGGFYAYEDLLVINACVVSASFFFSLIDTGIFFYGNWKKASNQPVVPLETTQEYGPISFCLGKVHHMVKPEDIRCAISQSRSVIVITSEERRLPYAHSLEKLATLLPEDDFFHANRQTVLSRNIVQSIKPLEHGKIEVSLLPAKGQPDTVTISRIRAAAFRKWLKG